ncbi:MAG: hypothetical protein M3Z64_05560 [Verrucomicrobiota bacterium]|nr:hypothetical protein [Verrucomicrobiota bacterium]
MTEPHTIADLRGPRSVFSTWIGIVLLFLVFGLFVLVTIGASPRGDHYEKQRAQARAERLKKARADATKTLTTYGWVDKAKGTAHIPINEAMHFTIVELSQKQPAPANPIAPETQAPGAQAAAPATAPAGSPAPSATPPPAEKGGHESETHNGGAASVNPAPIKPGSQPGLSATPPPAPGSQSAQAPQTPPPAQTATPPGTPLPIRGKKP